MKLKYNMQKLFEVKRLKIKSINFLKPYFNFNVLVLNIVQRTSIYSLNLLRHASRYTHMVNNHPTLIHVMLSIGLTFGVRYLLEDIGLIHDITSFIYVFELKYEHPLSSF